MKNSTKVFKKYAKLWWLMSKNSFVSVFYSKFSLALFLFGKILRFTFFILFLVFLLKGTHDLAGYDLNETLFFFLTFSLVDVVAQFLFREVYRFRPLLVSGDFDLILSKPMSPLFRVLVGGADVIDLITMPPLLAAVISVGLKLSPSFVEIILYVGLLINGLAIATAFHIAVLALAIVSLEIDHTVMIYRDVMSLGRLPIDIYKEPLRSLLTFLLPVGIMVSFPAKALIGAISPVGILISFVVGFLSLFIAIRFWNFALTKYTSASS